MRAMQRWRRVSISVATGGTESHRERQVRPGRLCLRAETRYPWARAYAGTANFGWGEGDMGFLECCARIGRLRGRYFPSLNG